MTANCQGALSFISSERLQCLSGTMITKAEAKQLEKRYRSECIGIAAERVRTWHVQSLAGLTPSSPVATKLHARLDPAGKELLISLAGGHPTAVVEAAEKIIADIFTNKSHYIERFDPAKSDFFSHMDIMIRNWIWTQLIDPFLLSLPIAPEECDRRNMMTSAYLRILKAFETFDPAAGSIAGYMHTVICNANASAEREDRYLPDSRTYKGEKYSPERVDINDPAFDLARNCLENSQAQSSSTHRHQLTPEELYEASQETMLKKRAEKIVTSLVKYKLYEEPLTPPSALVLTEKERIAFILTKYDQLNQKDAAEQIYQTELKQKDSQEYQRVLCNKRTQVSRLVASAHEKLRIALSHRLSEEGLSVDLLWGYE